MKIHDVTSSGAQFQPPSQPTEHQKMHAMAHSLLTQTAGALKAAALSAAPPEPAGAGKSSGLGAAPPKAAGAEKAAAVAAVGATDPNAAANNSLEALKDMAAIDTLAYQINNFNTLYPAPGGGPGGTNPAGQNLAQFTASATAQAIGLANDLITNCQGASLDAINKVINGGGTGLYLGGMARNFTITAGAVTAINFTQYDSDWNQTTDTTHVGGLQLILGETGGPVSIFIMRPSPFIPPWGLTHGNPDGLTNLYIFYANAMMNKTVTENALYTPNFDTFIWGSPEGGGALTNSQFFPVMAMISTYQDDMLNTSPPKTLAQFIADLQNLQSLLPTDAMIQASQGSTAFPDSNYLSALNDPSTGLSAIISYFQTGGAAPLMPPQFLSGTFSWLPTPPQPFGSPNITTDYFHEVYAIIAQDIIDAFITGQ